MDEIEIETPSGPARAYLDPPGASSGTLVLGHGAGGGVGALDLTAARRGGPRGGFQRWPWSSSPTGSRASRAPAPAGRLDAAWIAVVGELRGASLPATRPWSAAVARSGPGSPAGPRPSSTRRRGPLPRLPRASAGQAPRRASARRARFGPGADAGGPGRERPVRDAARRAPTARWSRSPATTASRPTSTRSGPRSRNGCPGSRAEPGEALLLLGDDRLHRRRLRRRGARPRPCRCRPRGSGRRGGSCCGRPSARAPRRSRRRSPPRSPSRRACRPRRRGAGS